MASPSPSPTPSTRRLRKWDKLRGRLRIPLSTISFPRTSHASSTKTEDEEAPTYLGGALPDDPFARGPVIILGRARTASAPTLLEHATCPSPSDKPLPSLPLLSPSTSLHAQPAPASSPPEYASGRASTRSETSSYHSCAQLHSDTDEYDDIPATPRVPRGTLALLQRLLETTTDDEDDDDAPQLPGAFRSSVALFRQAAAADLNPLSLNAAHAAFGRRAATACSLRRAASSPTVPLSKLQEVKQVQRVVRSSESGKVRPPSYSSGKAPSYQS